MTRLRVLLLSMALLLAVAPHALAGTRVLSAEAAAGAGPRIALVIGNSAYQAGGALDNPGNDAAAMTALLHEAGFAVTEGTDLGVAEFRRALADFEDQAHDADVAVIYYSGHGLELDGHNFLVPVDARIRRVVDVQDETVPLERVLDAVAGATKLKLVILDACRSDPFKATKRAVNRGLSRVEPTEANELIAYSAKAGTVAADGEPGGNSPFTTALLKRLTVPGLDVELALRLVRDDVLTTTHREQEPFYYGSMGGPQMPLVPALPPVAVAPAPVPGPSADDRVWSFLKSSNDVAVLTGFHDGLPASSPLRAAVEARLAELRAAQVAALPKPAEVARPPADIATPPLAAPTALGMALAQLSDDIRKKFKIRPAVKGVAVTAVDPGSRADEKAIRPGDVIVEVNLSAVSDPANIALEIKAMRDAGKKSALFLVADKQGQVRFVALALD